MIYILLYDALDLNLFYNKNKSGLQNITKTSDRFGNIWCNHLIVFMFERVLIKKIKGDYSYGSRGTDQSGRG